MALPLPHNLVVEGSDDQQALIAIMKAYGVAERIIEIHNADGKSNILNGNLVETIAKGQTVSSIGIILDADTDAAATYRSLRAHLSEFELPEELPRHGLISTSGSIRLGVWIMPDNSSIGALEELLAKLIPETAQTLWNHAVASAEAATKIGASFRPGDHAKAEIHGFLAWQDPPGKPYGTSITAGAFTVPNHHLNPLIDWLRILTGYPFNPTAP